MTLLDSSNNHVEAKALKCIRSESKNMIARLFSRASRLKMFTARLLRVFLATILSALFCNVSYFWLSLLPRQPYCTKSVCQEISYQFLYLFPIKKIPNEKTIRCQRNAFEKRVVFYCLYCSKRVKPTKNSTSSCLIEIPQHVIQKMKTKTYDFIGVDLYLRK